MENKSHGKCQLYGSGCVVLLTIKGQFFSVEVSDNESVFYQTFSFAYIANSIRPLRHVWSLYLDRILVSTLLGRKFTTPFRLLRKLAVDLKI